MVTFAGPRPFLVTIHSTDEWRGSSLEPKNVLAAPEEATASLENGNRSAAEQQAARGN